MMGVHLPMVALCISDVMRRLCCATLRMEVPRVVMLVVCICICERVNIEYFIFIFFFCRHLWF
jgi:hypothetical protein